MGHGTGDDSQAVVQFCLLEHTLTHLFLGCIGLVEATTQPNRRQRIVGAISCKLVYAWGGARSIFGENDFHISDLFISR